MRAHAVIGANYGDEGKGLIVDYLCAQHHADIVVRFNGGAQAGHTVVTPDNRRHVFHHIGAGAFFGVPTYLSRFFVVNPIQFNAEIQHSEVNVAKVFVDPRAIVTTPWDMLINQWAQKARGVNESCGLGINETMRRSLDNRFRITVQDMDDRPKIEKIMKRYVPDRMHELGLDFPDDYEPAFWLHRYEREINGFLGRTVASQRLPPGYLAIFEGAQGLALDQHSRDYPYVTHSKTGIANVLDICYENGINEIHATYVTRAYLTRHGSGPLPFERPVPDWLRDETNIDNPYQGRLRYAPLLDSYAEFGERIMRDRRTEYDIAVTCVDQPPNEDGEVDEIVGDPDVKYISRGPSRKDVETL